MLADDRRDQRTPCGHLPNLPQLVIGGTRKLRATGLERLLPGPAMIPFEVVTAGLLPPALREQYGLSWGTAQQRIYRLMVIALPRMVAVTPPVLRVWPLPGHNVQLEPSLGLST